MANMKNSGGLDNFSVQDFLDYINQPNRQHRSQSRTDDNAKSAFSTIINSFIKAGKSLEEATKEAHKVVKEQEKLAKAQLTSAEKLDRAIANYEAAKIAEKAGGDKSVTRDARRALSAAEFEKFGEDFTSSVKSTLVSSIGRLANAISSGIDKYIGAYSQYTSKINTRLQGFDRNFSGMSKLIDRVVGASQYVSQTKVFEKLNEYVDKGIAYNVEQRAFLGTVSEKIATTFDAANGTLLQLIRIQQADSTAARLGLESSLTKFLNSTFKDTSYLSGLSDTVSGAILGANSQLSRNGSLEFEYVVQKWLGSMSSVGVSESTIQSLAQGLNALGTGDINSLSNNTSLQNLLVMAASNAGLDYSRMLTGGMNATTANQLLESVVRYGQQIASSNNQVVKSQYAQLFGMTISDLTSLLNLSSKDLVSISKNMLDYAGAVKETQNEISTIGNRMAFKERLDILLENVLATAGNSIANSALGYTTWMITDIVEKATGGIAIPTISVMGNAVDLNTTVTALMKTGIAGIAWISKIGTVLAGLSGANLLSLDAFNAAETTGRGRGLSTTLSEGNMARTTSQTSFIGNTSSSDIYGGSIANAKDEAVSVQGQDESGNEMMEVIRDRIAVDVNTIVQLLGTDGIVIRSISPFAGLFGGMM